MDLGVINRKEFLKRAGQYCAGCCMGTVLGGFMSANAQDTDQPAPEESKPPRSETRIKFAEQWLTRFFDIMDNTLDEETRTKLMMTNGKICFQKWIEETGQKIERRTIEELAERAKQNKSGSLQVDGNTIYFQFMSAAETGLPSEEGQCLCCLVETKPKGLSGTYCLCSVGYVKEWFDQVLGKPVTVELIESVLRGGKRCKFKITPA